VIEKDENTCRITSPMVIANAHALLEAGHGFLATAAEKELRLDLASVREADSSALAVLFALRRAAAAHGRTLTVVNLPPDMSSLASLYGVTEALNGSAEA
jgi:phospholipid transport system transporter-binding protein